MRHDPFRTRAAAWRGMSPSAVREILKVAEHPDILSFAGGLPAPELFPPAELPRPTRRCSRKRGAPRCSTASPRASARCASGWRRACARRGMPATADSVLITNGAQQGIDLVARVLLDPGRHGRGGEPELPRRAPGVRRLRGELVRVASDEDGHAHRRCSRTPSRGTGPSSSTWCRSSRTRGHDARRAPAAGARAVAQRHGVPVLEDDPYGELRFRGQALPPLAALDDDGLVVHLGTFSKTLAPGLRIGWMHGAAGADPDGDIAKQACGPAHRDPGPAGDGELLEPFDYDAHLGGSARSTAALRGDARARSSATCRRGRAGRPDGGLFLWLELPAGVRDPRCSTPRWRKGWRWSRGAASSRAAPRRASCGSTSRTRAWPASGSAWTASVETVSGLLARPASSGARHDAPRPSPQSP